ncbi:MAG: ribosome recycling factor [Planctomycetota bacterium]|jgi:ribosome recycling factor
MDVDSILLECEDKMDKAVEYLANELKGVRTGRATPALVEFVKVDYYGSMTDLRQLAAVTVPEPTQLLVKPHDGSIVQSVIKAIQSAGLGLNPVGEGKQIRINLPPLSGDRRKDLANSVKHMGEQAKVAVRNIRRDANKHTEQLHKEKTITDDENKDVKDEIQDFTKKHEAKIEEMLKEKTHEILEM